MDGLKDLLAGRLPEEPPEVRALKRYVQEQFGTEVGIALNDREVIICAQSASLANALRLRGQAMQKICPPGKRLVIRIGR